SPPPTKHLSPPYLRCAHPNLPSFPTRRSSDLAKTEQPPQQDVHSRRAEIFQPHLRNDDRQVIDQCAGPNVAHLLVRVTPWTNPKDRKSTRLNSSHVKNSYAVFCLKKKTNAPAS